MRQSLIGGEVKVKKNLEVQGVPVGKLVGGDEFSKEIHCKTSSPESETAAKESGDEPSPQGKDQLEGMRMVGKRKSPEKSADSGHDGPRTFATESSAEPILTDKGPADAFSNTSTASNYDPNSSSSPANDPATGVSAGFAPSTQEDIMAGPDIVKRNLSEKPREEKENKRTKVEENPKEQKGRKKEFWEDINEEIASKVLESMEKLRRQCSYDQPLRETPRLLSMAEIKRRSANIMSKASAKERFEQLIEPQSLLYLPPKFKFLCRVASSLDSSINYYKIRNKLLVFDELKESVESTAQLGFTHDTLAQLLAVVPEFYTHYWANINGRKESALFIDVPVDFSNTVRSLPAEPYDLAKAQEISSRALPTTEAVSPHMGQEVIKQRAAILRQRLTSKIVKLHDEFLKKEKIADYDVNKKGWHEMFKVNLDSVGITERVRLREKPFAQESESVSDYIKKNDLKTLSVKSAIQSVSAEPECESKTESSIISGRLIREIKAKEKALSEYKKVTEEKVGTTEQKNKEVKMSQLAETLKSIFTTQKGAIIQMDKLVEKLADAERGLFIAKEDVMSRIGGLCKILPQWIKIVTGIQGKCLKLDKTFSMEEVLTIIKSHNNQ